MCRSVVSWRPEEYTHRQERRRARRHQQGWRQRRQQVWRHPAAARPVGPLRLDFVERLAAPRRLRRPRCLERLFAFSIVRSGGGLGDIKKAGSRNHSKCSAILLLHALWGRCALTSWSGWPRRGGRGGLDVSKSCLAFGVRTVPMSLPIGFMNVAPLWAPSGNQRA